MRIIFHIGMGKTGTSSIQRSLRRADDRLIKIGVKYLGLMLEHSPVKLYPWQNGAATAKFSTLDPIEAGKQVEEVLTKTARHFEDAGVHTLIWSNEWFFGRHAVLIEPMKRLQDAGFSIEIVSYVRRHDAWARSAYSQWGLKHKGYDGPIVPFTEYFKRRPIRFAPGLIPWVQAFGDNFLVRNFDANKNVVNDFCSILGIDSALLGNERFNESPPPEEMMLRALYNNRRKGRTSPDEFNKVFQMDSIDSGVNSVKWMESLLPTENDLDEIRRATIEDQKLINQILENQGQAKLSLEEKTPVKNFEIDTGVIVALLFQLIDQQAIQLQRLRQRVQQLSDERVKCARQLDAGAEDDI